jgi:hypothetical protein
MHVRYWQYYEIQYYPGLDLAFRSKQTSQNQNKPLCQGTKARSSRKGT